MSVLFQNLAGKTDREVCLHELGTAGRTKRVKLGSMVMAPPWHHPVRMADEVSFVDQVCGRSATGYRQQDS